ncbi:MAG: class I SAM-dependent methyltransferase [Caldilineae bacterium]|nr:MAG: class I SAM-dependent methyltransferase [Caldilineae bacterium]
MKVLESAPSRYDKGIRLLTRGGVDAAYDWLCGHVQPGQRALDIGCGTGALALRAARLGADVVGIDVNPQMLALARAQAERQGLAEKVTWQEKGVAELGEEADAAFDVIMSGLCFSELTPDERHYTLEQARRLLRSGGLLLLADETRPRDVGRRVLHVLIRLPLVLLTYFLTQTTTHALPDAPAMLREAGFEIDEVRFNRLHDFVAIVARNP